MVAIATWFTVFSAGVLLDSTDHRRALGFDIESEKFRDSMEFLGREVSNTRSLDGEAEARETKEARLELIKDLYREYPSESNTQPPGNAPSRVMLIYHFFMASFLFLPLNVLVLTLLSAFIGGCASNEADIKLLEEKSDSLKESGDVAGWERVQRHIAYMREDPLHSTLRGLIVYLVVISGLYIAVADPFTADGQASQLAQYFRLAGLLSVMGFVVGYDPSLFPVWISLVPTPASGKQPTPPSLDSSNTDSQRLAQSLGSAQANVGGAGEMLGAALEDLEEASAAAKDLTVEAKSDTTTQG